MSTTWYKCGEIKQNGFGNTEYLLKDENGNEKWFKFKDLWLELEDHSIGVINLHRNTVRNKIEILKTNYLYNFKFLASKDRISEKSYTTHSKAQVLGVAPLLEEQEVIKNLGGTYDNLAITDVSRIIAGNIEANTITFIGEQPLESYRNIDYYIECNKAIICNKCIMSNFVGKSICGNIKLKVKNIELNHEYIDVYTVYEMFHILNYTRIEGENESDVVTFIKTNFRKSKVTNKQIFKLLLDIIQEESKANTDQVNKLYIMCDIMLLITSLRASTQGMDSLLAEQSKEVERKAYACLSDIVRSNSEVWWVRSNCSRHIVTTRAICESKIESEAIGV